MEEAGKIGTRIVTKRLRDAGNVGCREASSLHVWLVGSSVEIQICFIAPAVLNVFKYKIYFSRLSCHASHMLVT